MILCISTPPNYRKGFVYASLARLSCRVVAFLEPGDPLKLPPNVEVSRAYVGDERYQDGTLALLAGAPDDEVVVVADSDSAFQRDAVPGELDPGDGFAAGYNIHAEQTAAEEFAGMTPGVSLEAANAMLDVDLRCVPMYNTGLVAARPPAWRRLRDAFTAVEEAGRSCVQHHVYSQQFYVCVAWHLMRERVRRLGHATHSHDLGRGPQPEHAVREKKLYFDGQLVFFVHYWRGVTHE